MTERRFGGVSRLFGLAGAERIFNAHVAVVGIGGVGSWVAESLARSGVRHLTLIDFDQVAESNINRQIHATEASLGMAKVDAMRERIHSFFPACQIHTVEAFAEQANWPQILPVSVNAVVDACDKVSAKTMLVAWSITNHCSFVTVGAAGGKRQAQLVCVEDLSQVTHDPLLAKVRYQLRKARVAAPEGKHLGVTSVFSRETVAPPDASCGLTGDGSLNCHGFGSLVTVTATFGHCAAGVILNKLSSNLSDEE